MDYIELNCEIKPFESQNGEIIIALLSDIGFESFVENDNGVTAYIQLQLFSNDILEQINKISVEGSEIKFNHKLIKDQNWNETWEKNYFEPVLIADKCLIRSTFHKNTPQVEFEILIDPKMSFGTGHHETTFLMIEEIVELNLTDEKILDMGCGTGILAILSSKKGAKHIDAIDIDEWSYNNSLENIKLNSIENIKVILGDKKQIKDNYNIIYANINKNILIVDIPSYVENLNKGGKLLLSGFYKEDFDDINNIASSMGLKLTNKRERNNWLILNYSKI